MKVILASRSPYKAQLLNKLNIPFTCVDAKIDESKIKEKNGLSFRKKAIELAIAKARRIQMKKPNTLIIGADQILVHNNKILSKPGTLIKAKKQLSLLAGDAHFLYTAYAIIYKNQTITHLEKTKLKMRSLNTREITRYLKIDNAIDTVGSYKLEELGISLFEEIQSNDFNSIVGLPLLKLSEDLRSFGFKIP